MTRAQLDCSRSILPVNPLAGKKMISKTFEIQGCNWTQ
jgi:hypothetical protein